MYNFDTYHNFSEQEFMIMIYKSDKNGRDQKEIHESALSLKSLVSEKE